MTPNLYATPPITSTSELDKLKKVVYLFSCHRKVNGETSKVLREKLILLVALYLLYGIDNKTKDKAAKILSVERSAINSMNMELRNSNYIVKDTMNTRINHLHRDLLTLSTYVKGDGKLMFLYTILEEE